MEDELGSGGFGVVRKGIWNGLLVAVKTMTSETSQKVINVCLSFPSLELTFFQDAFARDSSVEYTAS
jgi:hypothetical protein